MRMACACASISIASSMPAFHSWCSIFFVIAWAAVGPSASAFAASIADPLLPAAMEAAKALAEGPTAAHAMTKKMLHQEWNAGIDEAIEMEAQAQAILMQNKDFRRAYEAFVAKRKPAFEGA